MTGPIETTYTRVFEEKSGDVATRIFVLCSVAPIAAFGFWAGSGLPMFVRLLGSVAVAALLLICLSEVIKLVSGRHRVLRLSPQGFMDTNIAPETVPWTSVERLSIVSTAFRGRQRDIAVEVQLGDAAWESLTLTRGAKINRLQTDAIWIMHPGRRSEFGSFFETLRSYARANGGKVD
ncbi:hypothetical protein PV773_13095 [Mesorhizobium sp. CC13]|uniref:hypothetical protein n=1 Tax=Mesorhizobium sp. CC13 TaxID=3029194 RepID=UPI00326430DF